MKKTLMAAALVIALCASIAVPAWAAPSADEPTAGTPKLAAQQTQSGKWTINKKAGTYVTKAQKKLFKKATAGMAGVSYTPVFVMSTQIVEGTNYAYFCKAKTATSKPVTSWKVVIVNKSLSGKAKVVTVNNFNYKKVSTLNNPPKSSKLPGAWKNVAKMSKCKSKVLPKEARTAFAKATKKYTGVQLNALVLISKQTVSGMNYRYLCSGVIPGKKAVNYYVVDVYKNLKGKAKITACDPINMEKYLNV